MLNVFASEEEKAKIIDQQGSLSLDDNPEGLGKFQLDLRREVIESGEFYIVPTAKDGVAALRVTIINPLRMMTWCPSASASSNG